MAHAYTFEIKNAQELADVEETQAHFIPQINSCLEAIQVKLIQAKTSSVNHIEFCLPAYIDRPENMDNKTAQVILYHGIMTKLKEADYSVKFKRVQGSKKTSGGKCIFIISFPDSYCRRNIAKLREALENIEI